MGIGVQLSPTGNAISTASAVQKRMGELSKYFPATIQYKLPYDTSRFVKISISQVVETLGAAIVLVFLVMYLFLQNFRYTVIPTIVVPSLAFEDIAYDERFSGASFARVADGARLARRSTAEHLCIGDQHAGPWPRPD